MTDGSVCIDRSRLVVSVVDIWPRDGAFEPILNVAITVLLLPKVVGFTSYLPSVPNNGLDL